ncbi:MAG: hypothetical protein ABIH23_15960, partial [bacterium]
MRLRCLIVDTNPETRTRLESLARDLPEMDVQCLSRFDDAETAVQSRCPNLIILRFADSDLTGERVLKAIRLVKMGPVIIALFARPNPDHIKTLVRRWGIMDVLTDDAD